MNKKVIKVIGVGATLVGVLTTLVTGWVNDKTLDMKISNEVAKALEKKN